MVWARGDLHLRRLSNADTLILRDAPIAQRIERCPPEAKAQVRFLLGVLDHVFPPLMYLQRSFASLSAGHFLLSCKPTCLT